MCRSVKAPFCDAIDCRFHHFMDGAASSVFRNNFLLFSPGSAEHGETRSIQSETSGQRIPGRENAQVQKRRLLLSAMMKKNNKKTSLIN
jgi:hypothetical protein